MKTLKLPLTFHWYDETASGNKRIEYREMSPHWKRIIWDKRETFTHVRFQRGFQPPIKHQTFEVVNIDIGSCPIDGWDKQYYRIHFKDQEETKTCFDCENQFSSQEVELCPDENYRCIVCINESIDLGLDVL